MSVTVTGRVYQNNDLGMSGIIIILENPNHTFSQTTTTKDGFFCFANLNEKGTYKLYETATKLIDDVTLPDVFPQPTGAATSITPRYYTFTLTQEDLEADSQIGPFNFGHIWCEGFDKLSKAYYIDQTHSILYQGNCVTGVLEKYSDLSNEATYDALCVHPRSGYLFGYSTKCHKLFQIAPDNSLYFYEISTLPNLNYTAFSINSEGLLYLYAKGSQFYHIIDLNDTSSHYLKLIGTHPVPDELLDSYSWCFHPKNQMLYSLNSTGHLITFNLMDLSCQTSPVKGLSTKSCLSCFFDYQGMLYVAFPNDCTLYRIEIDSNLIAEPFVSFKQNFKGPITRCHPMPLYIHFASSPNHATYLSDNGPRHEYTNLLSFHATSNALKLSLIDQTFNLQIPVTNHTSKTAYLYSWIDYNNNGIFEISDALPVALVPPNSETKQLITLEGIFPLGAYPKLGEHILRMRLTTVPFNEPQSTTLEVLDPRALGPCEDGDIVDWKIDFQCPPPHIIGNTHYTGMINTSISDHLLVNDALGGTLIYEIISEPEKGLLSLDPKSGYWNYMPTQDFIGTETFILSAYSHSSDQRCEIPITIDIQNADVHLSLSSDTYEVCQKSFITYTLSLQNIGTLPLYNLHLHLDLPLGTSFKPHSMIINGAQDFTAHPNEALILDKLSAKAYYQISYTVCIEPHCPPQISHFISVECEYNVATSEQPLKLTKESNLVEIICQNPQLDYTFSCTPSSILPGDFIQYTLRLENTGTLELTHIQLTCALSMCLEKIEELTMNHELMQSDLSSDYIIEQLSPKESILLQFKGKTSKTTSEEIIDSGIFIQYDYTLSHVTYTSSQLCAYATCHMLHPKLECIKSPDHHHLALGGIITYTYTLTNKGDLTLENLRLQEHLPIYLDVTEIRLNQKLLPNTLEDGISLPDLKPSQSTSLKVSIQLLEMPLNKIIEYTEPICLFSIKSNDLIGKESLKCLGTHIGTIDLLVPELMIYKSVSEQEACVGNTVTYKLKLCNSGTTPLQDIIIQDFLTPELKFVEHSVKKDQHTLESASIVSGVMIDSLLPSTSTILTFDALILSKQTPQLTNTAYVRYQYKDLDYEKLRSASAYSNPCVLTVKEPHLIIEASVNQDIAFLEDCLTYTLKLKNIGDVDFEKIVLTLTSSDCKIIDHSFKVNDQIINSIKLNHPIILDGLQAESELLISYDIQVIGGYHHSHELATSIQCECLYQTLDQVSQSYIPEPYILSIPFALSTFKQFTLENELELPEHQPDLETLNSVGGQIQLLKHYIIETPKATSSEGQKLSGRKLIFHALLNLTIEYVTPQPSSMTLTTQYVIPFSSFIILPENCPLHAKIHLEALIEDILYKAANNRSFFMAASIFVTARIQ